MADQGAPSTRQYTKNLALAAVAGQAGCASLVIILMALILGLLVDSILGWRGPFTVGFLLCSAPLSLWVMVKIALGAVERIVPQPRDQQPTNPSEGGR